MKYKSVSELVIHSCSRKFSLKFLLLNQNKLEDKVFLYQNLCRIHLDEYEGQEELREEYLKKWYYWENIKKQYELLKNKLIAKAIGEPYISVIPRPSVCTELFKDFGCSVSIEDMRIAAYKTSQLGFPLLDNEKDPYQHFINRFNKRN